MSLQGFYQSIATTGRALVLAPAAGLMLFSASACGDRPDAAVDPSGQSAETTVDQANILTDQEKAEGWVLLFNGTDFTNWRGLGRDSIPSQHWIIRDGAIEKVASGNVPKAPDGQPLEGGDIMTVDTYDNFDIKFDFKLTPAANSGVKYNVDEEMSTSHPPRYAALGFEYQVLDDSLHPDAKLGKDGDRTASALYDMIGPNENKHMNPMGEWNQGRILKQGDHVEHWLNGEKVVAYDIGSPDFNRRLAESKYNDLKGFADNRKGHIVLQDHGDEVWYRNIKIRSLPSEQP